VSDADRAAAGPEAGGWWLSPGVRAVETPSFLSDLGREVPTGLLPRLLSSTQAFANLAGSAVAGLLWRCRHAPRSCISRRGASLRRRRSTPPGGGCRRAASCR